MADLFTKKDNQAYFYIYHIHILFITVIVLVSFFLCNFESAIVIVPIYAININDRWMIEKYIHVNIFIFSVFIIKFSTIKWCTIDEELQIKVEKLL